MNDGHISRRTILMAGGVTLTALTVGAAGLGESLAGASQKQAAGRQRGVDSPAWAPDRTMTVPSSSVASSSVPPSSVAPSSPARRKITHATERHARTPEWAGRWVNAICSIDDFHRRDRSLSYPRTAIMLTVDDGPDPMWTPKYLALFEKYGVTATFCTIGRQVAQFPELVRETHEHGHVIANHTWDHDEQLEFGSSAHLRSDIARASEVIFKATGAHPTQFRAPGGNWGPRIFAELARQQMMPLGWDIDPRDWARPGTTEIIQSMLAARRHDIVLCHDGGGDRSETYAALKTVLPALKARGLSFATLPSTRESA